MYFWFMDVFFSVCVVLCLGRGLALPCLTVCKNDHGTEKSEARALRGL
jgi:hypothetical protein